MRITIAACLLASAAVLGGCNTVRGVGSDVASVADAFDPNRTYSRCGTVVVDANADGRISTAEWNAYRVAGYPPGTPPRRRRISSAEYANCWYGGGFYTTYNRSAWEPSYRAFDAMATAAQQRRIWSANACRSTTATATA